tara:strand:+ start:133 stop:318 length:186 start_codon:yes stop_codon:yes gene_type:complete
MKNLFYSRKDVLAMTTFSRSLIDDLEQQGKFPKRLRPSPNRIVWVAAEVDSWFEEKINADR